MGASLRTQETDLDAVRDLAKFTRRSPDTLTPTELTGDFEHLVITRQLAPAGVRLMYTEQF